MKRGGYEIRVWFVYRVYQPGLLRKAWYGTDLFCNLYRFLYQVVHETFQTLKHLSVPLFVPENSSLAIPPLVRLSLTDFRRLIVTLSGHSPFTEAFADIFALI